MNEVEQRSDAWFQARLGKVTASRVADVIAKTKSGYSASRDNYMAQLICERLTGQKAESFTNSAMEWGVANEALAISAYENATNVLVEAVGFVDHPTIAMSGASPDGFVADNIICEVKCPQTNTQIENLLLDKVPIKYLPQIQWQLRCCERQYCDFISYDPRLPIDLQLFVKRVEFNQTYVAMLEEEVISFLEELEIKVAKLTNLKAKNEVRH